MEAIKTVLQCVHIHTYTHKNKKHKILQLMQHKELSVTADLSAIYKLPTAK